MGRQLNEPMICDTHFIQRNIWPMPGREQNGPMGAVPTPSGPWVPWTTANSTIPRPIWQTVNLSDRKVGRNVVLVFFLHGLCNITSDNIT